MPPIISNHYGAARVTRLAGRTSTVHKASSWDAAYSHHPRLLSPVTGSGQHGR